MTTSLLFSDLENMAATVSGVLEGKTRGSVRDVQVDSRRCADDSLFVAIPGEQTDGHLFLEDAFRRGSSLSFVSRLFYSEHQVEIGRLCKLFDASVVVVEDTVASLQSLARAHIATLTGLTVIAITGSNGKTTTKDLVGSMFSRFDSTAISPGNYNSDIGLPLACFNVTSDHRFAVFEMGMNRKGEIAELVSIVRPKVAAVTNIGAAHVGLVGSEEMIAREKREIFACVCDGGRGFVPEDDDYRRVLVEGRERCIDSFGVTSTPGYEEVEFSGLRGMRLQFDGVEVPFALAGRHNLQNALCAVSIANWFELPEECIFGALRDARPAFGRGQVLEGRAKVLLDCYNANRHSVLRALDLFDSISSTGRRILVLGSMKELGERSESEHRMVGRAVVSSSADLVLFVGPETEAAHREVVAGGSVESRFFLTFEALAEEIPGVVEEGDLVLIKGSRALMLERLVSFIDAAQSGEE